MSLAVGLTGSDGVVLAVDSRGTIGDPRGLTAISDEHNKLFQLSEHVGVCVFGASELALELVHIAQREVTTTQPWTDEAVEIVRGVTRKMYDNWFEKIPAIKNRPAVGIIIGGLRENATPRIVVLQSQLDFAPTVAATGFMMGGIPQYATYLVHRFYDRTKDVRSLANLATYLIDETASQDPKVGGPVRVATITLSDGYTELTPCEVEAIQTRNEDHSEAMKAFFYGSGENASDKA